MNSEGQEYVPRSLERARRKSFEGGSSAQDGVSSLSSDFFGRRSSFDSVIDVATSLVAKKNNDEIESPMLRRRRSFDRPEFALPELPTEMGRTGGLCLNGSADGFIRRAPKPPVAPRKAPAEPDKMAKPRQTESRLKSLAAGPGRTLGRLGALSAGAAAQFLNTATSVAASPLRRLPGFGTGAGNNVTAEQTENVVQSILPVETDKSSCSWELDGSARILSPEDGLEDEPFRISSKTTHADLPSPQSPTLPAPVLPSLETSAEEVVVQMQTSDPGPSPCPSPTSLRQRLRQRAGAAVGSASSSNAYSDTPAGDVSPSAKSDRSGKNEKSEKGKRRLNKASLELDMIDAVEDGEPESSADRRMSPRNPAGRGAAALDNASLNLEGDSSPRTSPRRRKGGRDVDAYASNEVLRQESLDSTTSDKTTSPSSGVSPSSGRRGSTGKARRSSASKPSEGRRKSGNYNSHSGSGIDFVPTEEEVSDERLEAFMMDVFSEYSIAKDKQLRPLMTGEALRNFMRDFMSAAADGDVNIDNEKAMRKADKQYTEEIERQVDMNFFFDVSKADAKRGLTFKAFCCLLDQVLTRGASRRIAKQWFAEYGGNAAAMRDSISSKPSGLIA